MEPSELLRRFVAALDELEIPYRVVGSVASMTYGEPRFTWVWKKLGSLSSSGLRIRKHSISEPASGHGQHRRLGRSAYRLVPALSHPHRLLHELGNISFKL